ncbi:MAG: ABC transporter ATP-binding protein [Candidatus Binatia bacterium]
MTTDHPGPADRPAPPLLEVRELSVRFGFGGAALGAVNGVDFQLTLGETLCLLGESGSGKTVTMRALIRLLPQTAQITGRVVLDGIDIMALDADGLQALRGTKVSMIFQDPLTAMDPVFTIGSQIAETVVCHDGLSYSAARVRALELLDLVQIPSARDRLDAYPHELSGGLRQRAMIALALSCRPKLLLADEPTTALDATVQIQILLLLRQLQRDLGMATIFVTHDLGVACEVADRVAVMYAGRFVETGTITEVIDSPRHPYTIGLLGSTVHAGTPDGLLTPIPGAPPDPWDMPPGCAFAPRCSRVIPACSKRIPELAEFEPGRQARCPRITES